MIWTLLVILHLTVSFVLVGAVLLQQGKGASMGILSGAGQTWFGPAGSKSLLMKITVGLSAAFLCTSLLLTLAGTRRPMASLPPQQEAPAGR